jgi:outer membrane protein assembly factor BamB
MKNCLISLLIVLTLAGYAAEVPLGSKDFYPSPERPVGFRGDGNGYYPGATPVTVWFEGTPKAVLVTNPPHKPIETFIVGDNRSSNIVWKTLMPGWANTQPIVVGDRVFTHAEPNQLVCVDAHTGKVLWTRATNVYATDGRDAKLAEQLANLREVYHVVADFQRCVTTNPPEGQERRKQFGELCEIFADKVIPRLIVELQKLDPTGNYADVAGKAAAAYREGAAAYKAGETVADKRKAPFDAKALENFSDTVKHRLITLSGEKDKPDLDIPWGNMVGWQMSVPVSDGQHVYTSLGQGATACYDLAGNLVWVKRMPLQAGGRTTTVQSPLLADGVLVDVHGGGKELVGLDALTGAEKWRAPTKGDFAFGSRSGYFVGSHCIVTLAGHDGKPVKVIVTTLGNIIRARDGKVLGPLPYDVGALSGGPSIMASGDIVMKGANGDGFSSPYVAYRLAFDGAEKVVAKELWRLPKTPGYEGKIATPTMFVIDGIGYEAATGKVLFDAKLQDGISHLLLGNILIAAESTGWRGPVNGQVANRFMMWDSGNGTQATKLSDRNLLGGDWRGRYVEYDKLAPELMAHPGFHHSWGGRPGHGMYTDTAVTASGNRLFIRTCANLYCIGNPAVKYDWNPSSRDK